MESKGQARVKGIEAQNGPRSFSPWRPGLWETVLGAKLVRHLVTHFEILART